MNRKARGCSVDGCPGVHEARGLCHLHYDRYRVQNAPPCSVEGCESNAYARGVCRMHHHRLIKHGTAGAAERQKRLNGTGGINRDGYRMVTVDGVKRQEHRVVMERVLGRSLLESESVHHRNGVRHDNRPGNLELWVRPQVAGQRVEDLIAFVVQQYPEQVADLLALQPDLKAVVA